MEEEEEEGGRSLAVNSDLTDCLYLCPCFPSHTFTHSWSQLASHPSMSQRGYGSEPGPAQEQHGRRGLPAAQTQTLDTVCVLQPGPGLKKKKSLFALCL